MWYGVASVRGVESGDSFTQEQLQECDLVTLASFAVRYRENYAELGMFYNQVLQDVSRPIRGRGVHIVGLVDRTWGPVLYQLQDVSGTGRSVRGVEFGCKL